VSTELSYNRSALVLDSDNGVWCHHSSSYSVYQGSPNYAPRAKSSDLRCHFTRPQNTFCQKMKKLYMYKKCIALVECNIFRKNHITQDVWLWNCRAMSYVVLSQKIWRALVYMNWLDSHPRVHEGITVGNCTRNRLLLRRNWYCMRGSSQQDLQTAFGRFSVACYLL